MNESVSVCPCVCVYELPDVGAVSGVGVEGGDPPHGAGGGAVLVHVQPVPGPGEAGGLVGVENHDPDGGPVLEGPVPEEAGVHHGVTHLHGEREGAVRLIVQQLTGNRKWETGSSTSVFQGQRFVFKSLLTLLNC